jgi:hypothetical protein
LSSLEDIIKATKKVERTRQRAWRQGERIKVIKGQGEKGVW